MFSHPIRVRYGECDSRGFLQSSAYLAYVDDAVDQWFKARLGPEYLALFDFMVKRTELNVSSTPRHNDTFEIVPVVSRWGRTSFDVSCRATAAGAHIYSMVTVYVSVVPGSGTPHPVPQEVRDVLEQS